MNQIIIKYKISDKNLELKKIHKYDSGFDLKVALDKDEITLLPLERVIIGTGITLELPNNIEGQIRPRSGLAINYGLTILNTPGTIDSGYRGEIKIILINLGKDKITIHKYDRIAQIIFQEKTEIILIQSDIISTNTSRKSKGMGSTGINNNNN